MDDQPTNVENLSPSFYIAICVLCSVTFDWLWLPRTFILLAMTFQSTRQDCPWATKASQAGSTKKSLDDKMSSNVLEVFPECAYDFAGQTCWACRHPVGILLAKGISGWFMRAAAAEYFISPLFGRWPISPSLSCCGGDHVSSARRSFLLI